MESFGGYIWILAVIGGPILLGLAFAYGILRRRRRTRQSLSSRERLP